MNFIPETQKIYQNHRDNQLERILEAAEKLFIRDGIDNVSISAIAAASRLSRKTLYEYYSNKQEIAWAIMQYMSDEKTSDLEQPRIPEGNGFQRIEYFMLHMVNLLEAHPEHFRFISEFNNLYAREGNPDRVRQIYAGRGEPLIQMIQQGISDGSICPDVDPGSLSAAIFNLVSGMNSRFALLGDQISEEYGKPAMELYHEICRIFLRGICATPSAPESRAVINNKIQE
jgi:AcrR family transcriptional regulator